MAALRKAGMILLEAPISKPQKPETSPKSYQGICSEILFGEAPCYRHTIREPIDVCVSQENATHITETDDRTTKWKLRKIKAKTLQ